MPIVVCSELARMPDSTLKFCELHNAKPLNTSGWRPVLPRIPALKSWAQSGATNGIGGEAEKSEIRRKKHLAIRHRGVSNQELSREKRLGKNCWNKTIENSISDPTGRPFRVRRDDGERVRVRDAAEDHVAWYLPPPPERVHLRRLFFLSLSGA